MSAVFVETLFRLGKSTIIARDDRVVLRDIEFPKCIDVSTEQMQRAGEDHYAASVPLSSDANSRFAEDYAMSGCPVSSEFVPEKLFPIVCRRCATVFIRRVDKCLPLPSEQWIELSELWVCHPLPHEHPNHHKPYGLEIKPIQARPGAVLVGKEYFQVHEDDCQSLKSIAGGILICEECEAPIGTKDDFGFRLLKFELASGAQVRLERLYTVERCVAEQLIDSQANKNKCRLLLTSSELFQFDDLQRDCDSDQLSGIISDFAICLTLFDWNISIWSSDWPNREMIPAVKVFFKIVDDFDTSDYSLYSPTPMSKRALVELRKSLEQNQYYLPKSLQQISGKQISYLCRFFFSPTF
jgi:hypothetical protein